MTTAALIGTATLDGNVLVDSLVPDVIDGLRDELHPQFGVRAYRVYRVIRTWAAKVGTGKYVDDAAELRPYPLVWEWNGYRYEQAPCGIKEVGEIKLTEVSLTYAADQLDPQNLTARQEAFFALADANGQRSPVRMFWHKAPPYIDRVKNLGWVLMLNSINGAPPWVP